MNHIDDIAFLVFFNVDFLLKTEIKQAFLDCQLVRLI